MDYQHLELPVACAGPADDLWRIELEHVNGRGYVDNIERSVAEDLMLGWTRQKPGSWVNFCGRCPNGRPGCPHPTATSFLFAEITSMRIMPMREAV